MENQERGNWVNKVSGDGLDIPSLEAELMPIVKRIGDRIKHDSDNEYALTGHIASIEKKPDDRNPQPVTKYDEYASTTLKEALRKLTPGRSIPILDEEDSEEMRAHVRKEVERSRTFWTIDPLDGTSYLIRRDPRWSVLVSLVQDGKPVLGIVYNPAMNLWYYTKEGAAYKKEGDTEQLLVLNGGTPSHGFRLHDLSEAPWNAQNGDVPYKWQNYRGPKMQKKSQTLPRQPELFLLEDKTDLHVSAKHGPKIWDIAPIAAIFQAAGGQVLSTNPYDRKDNVFYPYEFKPTDSSEQKLYWAHPDILKAAGLCHHGIAAEFPKPPAVGTP